ncbi:MAG: YlxR family protein [Oscillospiraceae bacterium]|nr:YlxR family protein [Oscillospiraceae bacterium]MBQ2795904.1 YlxR family protein [Oscillospiraceae bacterium]MBQ2862426.1 YlxR family protein [Oscillospiraceae bacterium]MBQ2998302.1 YlxR family protein [Oscillospiraceae bacterium]MBQ3236759.1 YlxR family protein [Oscillospiraceae bacterium]
MKKVPMRMCTGCGEMKPKRELIRVVKSPEGVISLDKTGRSPGRGAYVCPNAECLKKARKTKRIERVFETQIPEEVYEALEKELEDNAG